VTLAKRVASGIIAAMALALLMVLALGVATSRQPEAQGVALAFYDLLRQGEFHKTVGLLSPGLLASVDGDDWPGTLRAIQSELGDVQQYKLTGSSIRVDTSGATYALMYEVKRANGRSDEELTISGPLVGGKLRIEAYEISPWQRPWRHGATRDEPTLGSAEGDGYTPLGLRACPLGTRAWTVLSGAGPGALSSRWTALSGMRTTR
jgi:hypothetical protein